MSTRDPPAADPKTYAFDNVTVERVGNSVKLTRSDIAGGCIHVRCEAVENIAAAMRTLADE